MKLQWMDSRLPTKVYVFVNDELKMFTKDEALKNLFVPIKKSNELV